MWPGPGIVPGSSKLTLQHRGIVSRQVEHTTPRWSYEAVRDCLTNERLSSYMDSMGHDLEKSFHLYEWNMRASAAILNVASMTEVVVRNAVDRELLVWANDRRSATEWFDIAPLDVHGKKDVNKARERATRQGKDDEVHGKVIAELSLGFWRFLVESRYFTSLWVPAVHRAFPDGPKDLRTRQRAVAKHLKRLHFVRDRAAHHEPIPRGAAGRDRAAR